LRYVFHNFYRHIIEDIGIKGLKITLKGKISSAGNARKKTIMYKLGKTSNSTVNLRVVEEFTTISTFTGVMGLTVLFYY